MASVERELGDHSASLRAIERTLESMDRKLDDAQAARDSMFQEMRTLKHDQRNTEQSIVSLNAQVQKSELLFENRWKTTDEKLAALEKWQDRMITRLALLGTVGTMLGAAIVLVIKYIGPLLQWMEGKHDH